MKAKAYDLHPLRNIQQAFVHFEWGRGHPGQDHTHPFHRRISRISQENIKMVLSEANEGFFDSQKYKFFFICHLLKYIWLLKKGIITDGLIFVHLCCVELLQNWSADSEKV